MSTDVTATSPETSSAPAPSISEAAKRPSLASASSSTQPTSQPAEVVTGITIEALRDFLQGAGYRVEIVRDGKVSFLRSATNGLAFDLRPGNPVPGMTARFADVAFVALFAVQGALPLDLLNRWNATRRFGRLFLDRPTPDQQFLVFCLDVSIIGGVTMNQLRGQLEIWDGLVQQLIPWLREEVSKIAPTVDSASGSTGVGSHAAAPNANGHDENATAT